MLDEKQMFIKKKKKDFRFSSPVATTKNSNLTKTLQMGKNNNNKKHNLAMSFQDYAFNLTLKNKKTYMHNHI